MRFRFTLLFAFSSFFAFAQSITRVEPPNWWVGMEHNTVELLIYGNSIASLTPVIKSTEVELKQTTRTGNTNYLFLTIEISDHVQPGEIAIEFYRGKKLVTSYMYPILRRDPASAAVEGFDSSDVMYLITPDRFANGNPDNDQVSGMAEKPNRSSLLGRHGGDIKGMQDHLDYISDMGFTAIWINPIIENDMPEYSYHGYAATDFYAIDRRFGSNEEYRDFCAAASAKGIKVIMDMIMNHCGSEHWFVKDPPASDWINNQDNFVQTSHRRNANIDPYASEFDKKAFSDGWFVRSMPDLNQRNKQMATYLIQNTLWWIEYSGISAIRMDTYPYPDKYFMRDWTCAVMEEYPKFNIVGEEWTTNPVIVSYWQAGKENHDGYTSCLPSLMDFPMQDAVKRALTEDEKQYGSGLIKAYEMLSMDFLYPDPDNLVVFPDNHDMARFYTQIDGDFDLFKMGMIYYATIRGIPQFYYGTEVLMNSDDNPDDHGLIRSDFPGGWSGDMIDAFSGKGLSAEQKMAQDFTKGLLKWRKSSAVVHQGQLLQFSPDNGVYCYFRYDGSQKLMVVFNKNEEETSLEMSRYAEMLTGHTSATDVLTGKSQNLAQGIKIAGRSALILAID